MFRFILGVLVVTGIAILSPERGTRSSTDVVHEVSRAVPNTLAATAGDLAGKAALEMMSVQPPVRAAVDRLTKAAPAADRPLEIPPLRR
jgi:hypothetical protein